MKSNFQNNELQPVKLTLDPKDIYVDGELTYNGDATFDFTPKNTNVIPLKNAPLDALSAYVNISVLYPTTQIIFKRTANDPKDVKKQIHDLLLKYSFERRDKYVRMNYSWPKWDHPSCSLCYDIIYDDSTSMLKIDHLSSRWYTEYQGFCKSLEEFKKILSDCNLSHLIMTKEQKIEHFRNRVLDKYPEAKFLKSWKYSFSTVLSKPFDEEVLNTFLEGEKSLWSNRFLSPVSSLRDYEPLLDVVVHDELTAWHMASTNLK